MCIFWVRDRGYDGMAAALRGSCGIGLEQSTADIPDTSTGTGGIDGFSRNWVVLCIWGQWTDWIDGMPWLVAIYRRGRGRRRNGSAPAARACVELITARHMTVMCAPRGGYVQRFFRQVEGFLVVEHACSRYTLVGTKLAVDTAYSGEPGIGSGH